MKIFKLQPNDETLNEEHWRASQYKGSMVIRTKNEDRARRIAYSACGIAVENRGSNGEILANPWSKTLGLVKCSEFEDSSYSSEGEEEEILEPAHLNDSWKR